MRDVTREADAATLRGWLLDPRAGSGVHLATDAGEGEDGWEFAPYPELADRARRIARALIDEGVTSGSTVGVLMPTSHLCLATLFAVLAAGATLTPISPPQFEPRDSYVDRVHGVLVASRADVLVGSPAFTDVTDEALARMPAPPRRLLLADTPDVAPLDDLVAPGPVALLQMTSGSTGSPRGVQVTWRNLVANLGVINRLCGIGPGDRGCSWLPLYHDMGLIGGLFTSVPGQYEMRLLRPDQFIRDPLKWLQATAVSEHSVSPSFGLEYVSRRLTPADLGDIDLSGLRSLVIGADRINPEHLRAFTDLTAGHGFSPGAFVPSYGLAEMTLIATAQHPGEPIRMARVDRSTLRPGAPVRVLDHRHDVSAARPSSDWIVSVGQPAPGHRVRIADDSGDDVPAGVLGEIVLSGPSVAAGYRGSSGGATRFDKGDLYTGDAGFIVDDRLHVIGRMGTSLKINGRNVFTEDLDVAAAEAMGIAPRRLVTVAVNEGAEPGVAMFIERSSAPLSDSVIARGATALRAHIGEFAPMWLITTPRGGLIRTSSGKPCRSKLWQHWRSGQLTGAELVAVQDPGRTRPAIEGVRAILEKVRGSAVVPDDATVHFEGSLAEGFGNSGSDIDFLLLVPGATRTAVMPTVLFVDGRRVEIRTQSHDQVRQRLLAVRRTLDTGSMRGISEDLLNRVQRFCNGVPLKVGPHYPDVTDIVSHRELAGLIAAWWRRRSGQCFRHSAALVMLDAEDEALNWARDGLVQAMKAFLAEHGESYLEVKWLPEQIARLRRRAGGDVAELLDDYLLLVDASADPAGCRALIERLLHLAARLGAPAVTIDPGNVTIRRAPGVSTWPVGSTTHVVRDKSDVFTLSAECAESWRKVVFGETLARTGAAPRHLRLFARYGLILLAWRGAGVLRPAAAMCEPDRSLTPPPTTRRPVVTIDGAPAEGDIARSPLAARAFAECAGALLLANMVLENAREDFDGAVKDGQWQVASLCGRRIAIMAVRILASGWGVTPLPADPVLLDALDQLVPEHPDLAPIARHMTTMSIHDDEEALRVRSALDDLVDRVRRATGGEGFPASFGSREQWQQTLRYGYQWLRMGGYLNADLPLDETRDLLTNGGVQPGERR